MSEIECSKIEVIENFKCKIFEPATAELSRQDLKEMLKTLYGYYPVSSSDGKKQPYRADSDYSKQWFQCYDHLLMLLDTRKQQEKFNISIALSSIALLVSILAVLIRIFAEN